MALSAADARAGAPARHEQAPSLGGCDGGLRRVWQAAGAWGAANGERITNAAATALMCGAALHAVYLGAVPEPLRVIVAQRNARLWKRLALGTLLAVAAYDGVQSSRMATRQHDLAVEAKQLRAQLQQLQEQ